MPWFKCDVGIATHPKVLTAGPLALAVQIRAICYAAQNLTDGFIPTFAVPLLTTGMDEIHLCIQDTGDGVSLSESAAQIDWPSFMVSHGLWHEVCGGYQIHDYLQWNPSKKEIEDKRKKQSFGGMKGMKSRYGIENKMDLPVSKVISKVISNDITSPSISISYSSLNSGDKKNGKVRARKTSWPDDLALTDELRSIARERGFDPEIEFQRAKDHCLANGKQYANYHAFLRNWFRNDQFPKKKTMEASITQPCQERVYRGLALKPCGDPSVTIFGGRPLCQTHKEYHERKSHTSTT